MVGRLLTYRELRSLAQAYLEGMDCLAKHRSDPVGIQALIALGRVEFSAFKIVDGPCPGAIAVDRCDDLERFGSGWAMTCGTYVTQAQVRDMARFLIEAGIITGIESLIAEALGGEAA